MNMKMRLNLKFNLQGADILVDILNNCYGESISITKPEVSVPPVNCQIDEERAASPVHLSSSLSVSSERSTFSTRFNVKSSSSFVNHQQINDKIPLAVGRGRSINLNFAETKVSFANDRENSSKKSFNSEQNQFEVK